MLLIPWTVGVVVGSLFAASEVASAFEPATKQECIDSYSRAQDFRKVGELRRARQELLVCASSSCALALRTDCAQWLSEVERLIPSIVLGATDAEGHDLVDVTVRFDGTTLTEHLDGRPVDLDPGEHVLRFTVRGRPPVEQRLVIREGEKARSVVATISVDGGSAKTLSRPASNVALWSTWVFGVASVVGVATAVGAGAVGLSTWNRCHLGGCTSADQTRVDDLWLAADIGASVAVVGAVLAAYSFFARDRSKVSARPRVDVRGGRGLWLTGAF